MVKTDIGFIILVLREKGLYDFYNFMLISLDKLTLSIILSSDTKGK